MPRGAYQHRVRFENPGVPVPDGDGGYTQGYTPLDPPEWFAAILPATVRDLERQTAGTVTAAATHIIVADYHGGVSIQTRVVKLDDNRVFAVTGLANRAERDVTMALFCQEQLT
jgi:head-tail adaptor